MSVRARDAPVPVQAIAKTSRLEAVLAAGMARVTLVPTDAPKRRRSGLDLLELLDETEERSTLEERRAREADERHNRAELRDFPKTLGEIEQLLDEDEDEDKDDPTPGELDSFLEGEELPSLENLLGNGNAPDGYETDSGDDGVRFTPEQMLSAMSELDDEAEEATVVRIAPGTPPMNYPVWVTLGALPRTPPPPPPPPPPISSSSSKSVSKMRFLNNDDYAYLFWYLMHPLQLEDDIAKITSAMQLEEEEVRQRLKRIRMLCRRPEWGIIVPEKAQAPWLGATLAPDPPYPTDSSADVAPGQNRYFTRSEMKYLYWNLMQPARMNMDEITDKLKLSEAKVLAKLHWMRFKMKSWGYEVPDAVIPKSQRGKQKFADARKSPATEQEREAAVDALVESWSLQPRGTLSFTARNQAVMDLARELGLSSQSVFIDLARRHPLYARPNDIKRLKQ